MENKPKTIQEIVNSEGWKAFSKKLEMLGAGAFGIALILFFAKLHGYHVILTLGGSTLAIAYYFEAFKTFPSTSKFLSFAFYKIYGFGLAISWVFIVFIFQNWPYPKTAFFFLSLIALLISLLLGLRLNNQEEHPEINRLYFVRLLIALGMIVFVYVKFIQ